MIGRRQMLVSGAGMASGILAGGRRSAHAATRTLRIGYILPVASQLGAGATVFAQEVAKNIALNWQRRNKRVQDTSLESLDDPSLYLQEDPTTRLNDSQDAISLLERLPEDQQELLILYFFREYTVEQIAKDVGTTANAVWKKITRTIERLQRVADEPPRASRIRHFLKKGKEQK